MAKPNIFVLFLLVAAALTACSSQRKIARMPTPERVEYAKKLYDNGKYLDAKTQYQILILNNPGSSMVDTAQYYLGDCYFHLEEYITAAAEFEKLVTLYPRSSFVDDAQLKIGLAYFELSPKHSLDQKYTYNSIDALQQFLEEYPNSEHVAVATEKLQECRAKLALKEYETGDHYRKLRYFDSANISYNAVIRNFLDTEFAEAAYFWKAFCHLKLDELEDARDTLQILLSKYPKTRFRDKARGLADEIESRARVLAAETAVNGSQN